MRHISEIAGKVLEKQIFKKKKIVTGPSEHS